MARQIILIRHGETEWSKSGKHTSTTDVPLTDAGTSACEPLARYLKDIEIDRCFSSPMARARTTAKLSLGDRDSMVKTVPELLEWNYGDYEGKTSPEIREHEPKWNLWSDGCPNGESPDDVEERISDFIDTLEHIKGTVVCFAHGHILRSLAAMWITPGVTLGEHLHLDTATISILGYEHASSAILQWNTPVS